MTATEKWDKEWFMDLPPKLKCLWIYLNDKCDQAGMWEVNYRLASMHIGETISEKDIEKFGERLEKFGAGKIWVVDHVAFQCGTLSDKSPAHKPIFTLLKKYRLLDRVLSRVSNTLQEIETEKEEEREEEKVPEIDVQMPEPTEVKFSDEWFRAIFDELFMAKVKATFPRLDLVNEASVFKLKVGAKKHEYEHRDAGGMRQAFIYQLARSKAVKPEAANGSTIRISDQPRKVHA